MSDLEVRPASIHDATPLEPLLAEALATLRALRGGAALLQGLGIPGGTDGPSLATALCANAVLGASTLVATIDGEPVGLAVVARGADGLDLVGVHTARHLRRRRIGTALLDAAQRLAEASGERLEALALPGDQAVKSLLEAAGYRARLLRMSAER